MYRANDERKPEFGIGTAIVDGTLEDTGLPSVVWAAAPPPNALGCRSSAQPLPRTSRLCGPSA